MTKHFSALEQHLKQSNLYFELILFATNLALCQFTVPFKTLFYVIIPHLYYLLCYWKVPQILDLPFFQSFYFISLRPKKFHFVDSLASLKLTGITFVFNVFARLQLVIRYTSVTPYHVCGFIAFTFSVILRLGWYVRAPGAAYSALSLVCRLFVLGVRPLSRKRSSNFGLYTFFLFLI